MKPAHLSFARLAEANANRLVESYEAQHEWQPQQWALAACGPMGYIAHLLSARITDGGIEDSEIFEEIADAIIYLDHLCTSLGGTLGTVVARKFKTTSDELGSIENLPCLDAPDV